MSMTNVLCIKEQTLSFVIPVKNDVRINQCIAQLHAYAMAEGISAEIIVCGELDSGTLVKGAHFFKVAPSRKGECVQTGILRSRGSVIIVCDADLPVRWEDLKALWQALKQADIAVGNRYLPASRCLVPPPLSRRLASVVFRLIVTILFDLRSFDTQCGVKAYRRPAGLAVFSNQIVHGLAFDVEAIMRARALRLRMDHIPVHWRHSTDSTIRICRVAPAMLIDIANLRMRWKSIYNRIVNAS